MDINKQLNDISEIKKLMEKSSKFISLSGLSGVFAGVFALIGATIVYIKYSTIYNNRFDISDYSNINIYKFENISEFAQFTVIVGITVLILAITTGIFFTYRKAKKSQNLVWDSTSKRLLINLFIPLITGAVFILILAYHNILFLIAPATLIFYGLSLINASKYTLHDVKYLGILEVILGLISAFFVGYGLIFWAVGFGVLHIIYGISMYIKYDK